MHDAPMRPDLLSASTAFAGLTPEQLGELAAKAEPRNLRRGEVLLRRGEPSDALHFVVFGRFAAHDESPAQPIAEIGQGQPIGEIGFFANLPRTLTVTALRDSQVLTITRERFGQISNIFPGVQNAIIRALSIRLAEVRQFAREPAAPRTIAVLWAGQSRPSAKFLALLREVFGARDKALFLTRAIFEEKFGAAALDEPLSSHWLHGLEIEARFVFYIADEALTDWTRKCVRQADVVLLVAAAGAGVTLNEAEAFAFALHAPGARRLALLHERRAGFVPGARSWLRDRDVFMHHHVALQDAADVARLHRFLCGRALGFVAGGGGALGSAHLGVYKAFREAGADFDIFGGTSAGAALAAALAAGLDAEAADDATHNIFIKNRAFRRYTVPYHAILDHKVLDRALRAEFGDIFIEDLWRPYFAISTNLSDNAMMVHRRGAAWRAVRASGSIPGLLPPFFTDEGKMLVDGGLIDNVPLAPMKALKGGPNVVVSLRIEEPAQGAVDYDSIPGLRELVAGALNPFARRRSPRAPTLLQVITLSMIANRREDLPLGAADLLIYPKFPAGVQWTKWERHTEVFISAYRGAVAAIAEKIAEADPCLATILDAREAPAAASVLQESSFDHFQ